MSVMDEQFYQFVYMFRIRNVRGLKPGLLPGETHSMPRDIDEPDSDEYLPDDSEDEEDALPKPGSKRPARKSPSRSGVKRPKLSQKVKDDGDFDTYQKRLRELHKARVRAKYEKIARKEEAGADEDDDESDGEERFETFPGGYKISHKVWNKLFQYQQVTVRWLWELKQKKCGGIIGDEMGLGKTIQMIAYLIGLAQSKQYDEDFRCVEEKRNAFGVLNTKHIKVCLSLQRGGTSRA